jgi:poly-beta-1,6-N-acetyl-D-glucosamine synthase
MNLCYVIITPARNEEKLIEGTIRSMISQVLLPLKWVIVSDGSTDSTDAIVQRYLPKYPWIQLVQRPIHNRRDFAGKVAAFEQGRMALSSMHYDLIGSMDADLTFGSDYFLFLAEKFAQNPRLGLAGTPFVEGTTSYDYRFTNIEHVSGSCQLFRRECFEDIGGYTPIKGGGIDWVAVTTSRMKGWETRTYLERVCHHHRPMGTASVGIYRALYRLGRQEYYLGGHPIWQFFRAAFQVTRKPYVIGGMCLLLGYWHALLTRIEIEVSPELVRFHRAEQMKRLRRMLFPWLRRSR